MDEIVTKILDVLGVFAEDEIKSKHGNSPSLTYEQFISRVISGDGSVSKKIFPEYGEQTVNRFIKKAFPTVKLNGGCLTWSHYLLSLIEHKKCFICSTIKSFDEFHKDSSSSLGIASCCKTCRNLSQRGTWKNYEEAHRKSYKKNYDKIRARNAEYRAERLKRTVPWTEHTEIEKFYRQCPEGYQVDHILPLKGKLVSGLHVLANLQYLSIKDNLSKGNRVDLEAYNAGVAKLVETHKT